MIECRPPSPLKKIEIPNAHGVPGTPTLAPLRVFHTRSWLACSLFLLLILPAGLFQPLDDFLRTSTMGEFFARLQMVRAFAAQLGSACSPSATGGNALGTVLQGLWQYYSQV